MDLFCQYLGMVECKFFVTNSFRRDSDVLNGAVVPKAKMSNHLIGCAIDGNLVTKNNTYWTDAKIKKEGVKNEQLAFVNLIRNSRLLRWGGDFDKEDEKDRVHYDNAINILNPDKWQEIYSQLKTKTT
ncbi:MAG: M15 family metallopeptidase [Nitrososphaerales archaeon]